MERHAVKVGPGDRIVIPAPLWEKTRRETGRYGMAGEDNEQVRISSVRQAIRHVQDLVARYAPGDRSLADELIAERREEAARE